MQRRHLLIILTGAVLVAVIAVGVITHDGRSRVMRAVDCLHGAGYSTTVVHDSGLVPAESQDPDVGMLLGDDDGMIQAHDPSDMVSIGDLHNHGITMVTFPQDGPPAFTSPLVTDPEHERTIRDCVGR